MFLNIITKVKIFIKFNFLEKIKNGVKYFIEWSH